MPLASELIKFAIDLSQKEKDDKIVELQKQIDELKERIEKLETKSETEDDSYDEDLYEMLRIERNNIADELNVAPYCVLYNSVLEDIARKKPKTIEEIKKIKGIKDVKASKYGPRLLQVVNSYLKPNGVSIKL